MCALFYLLENHNVLLTKANTNFYVFCHFVIKQRDIWVTQGQGRTSHPRINPTLFYCHQSFIYNYNPMLKYTDSKYIANCRAWRIIWRESWKTFQTFLGRLRGVRGGERGRAGRSCNCKSKEIIIIIIDIDGRHTQRVSGERGVIISMIY